MTTFDNPAGVPAPPAAARMKRFTGPPPTSTAVEVSRLAAPGALLEVEVTAAV
jgi:enamine deaminase RidA (YjgF/YER057c/UK114 family)